jgi:RNA polymerase sigma factor (sigma-70 family)
MRASEARNKDVNTMINFHPGRGKQDCRRSGYAVALAAPFRKALCGLGTPERNVLELYYGLTGKTPLTLQEIADLLGLVRDQVQDIKHRAVEKLRDFAKDG